jgi:hypothetical protein
MHGVVGSVRVNVKYMNSAPKGRHTLRRSIGPAVILVLAFLVLSSMSGTAAAATASGSVSVQPHFAPGPHIASKSQDQMGMLPPVAKLSGDDGMYMQEFSVITGLNGGESSFTSGYMNVTMPKSSPYDTAYEFNAVSNTGDWYQATVGYDWPGGLFCTSGFHDGFEWFNNAGVSVGQTCDWLGNPSAGDVVALYIYIASSGEVCMEVYDWSSPSDSNSQCVTQPNPGSTPTQNYFPLEQQGGYFTGPMTEIIASSVTLCTTYAGLPTVGYTWPESGPLGVQSYIMGGDEWNPSISNVCYDNEHAYSVAQTGFVVTQYFNTASGSTVGHHWVAGQDISTGGQWRLQTDVVPLILKITSSALQVQKGQLIYVYGAFSGGVAPYQESIWYVNGKLAAIDATVWSFTVKGTGDVNIVGYLYDSLGDGKKASLKLTNTG